MTEPRMPSMLAWLERLFFLTVGGALVAAVGMSVEDPLQTTLIIIGVVAMVPLLIYLNVVPIWHWKVRYRGQHSLLWGIVLVLETSGWFKIVYWFRHLVPDIRARGRYLMPEPRARS